MSPFNEGRVDANDATGALQSEEEQVSLFKVEDVAKYHVYEYHFLDDLRFIRKPEEIMRGEAPEHVARVKSAVAELFQSKGWEGNGDIGILWLPPFADCGIEDTWGTYVWHVKQSNNGTSWLASREPLEFDRLRKRRR